MTLGELFERKVLVHRTVEMHGANRYARAGKISAAVRRGENIVMALARVVQRFEGGRGHGNWKRITCFPLTLDASTPVEACGKIICFTLPDGGRGYFLPRGKNPPVEVAKVEDE